LASGTASAKVTFALTVAFSIVAGVWVW
ncbi:MAG: succinate dehydrogenase cytochrome b556 large subunit, partial [Shewanella sp.]